MSKKKIIAIQADSLNSINIKTDTTFLLALEAQKRGNKIYWYQTKDLNFIKGKVYANVEDIRFYENRSAFYKILKKRRFDLSKANYLLIRQNPPFNMDYITSTFFLESISKTVKIINNPIAIRNVSEKFYSINFLKFKNILNSRFINNNKFLSQLIPFNKKINGNIIINVDKIASSSNIINSGNANLEFRNSVLMVKEIKLIINKIGNIKLAGKIFQQKKKKVFIFNTKINLDNPKIFYSRFLIPKKNRIDLVPINLLGKIDLESYEIKLDKIYLENALNQKELDEDKLFFLQERINEIFSQNSLNNILKYSNLRKIIQSFFN